MSSLRNTSRSCFSHIRCSLFVAIPNIPTSQHSNIPLHRNTEVRKCGSAKAWIRLQHPHAHISISLSLCTLPVPAMLRAVVLLSFLVSLLSFYMGNLEVPFYIVKLFIIYTMIDIDAIFYIISRPLLQLLLLLSTKELASI
jgi:hypothetical protein